MFKKQKLEELRNSTSNNCVSIYIPTEITGDYEKNRIRWKNACQEVLKILESKGVEKTSFMKPALDLIDKPEFWAHQSAGLAGFYSENNQSHHHLISKCVTSTVVDSKFHLSPVIKEVLDEDRIFVLALSHNEVRFFEAVNSGIYPVIISDVVPKNMAEALYLDITGNSIQWHTSGNSSLYHGTDPGDDKEDIRLKQYFRSVDKGLLHFINDEKVPLVIAGVEEYYSVYKEITNYNYLSPHIITGNPEHLSPADFHSQLTSVFAELHEKRLSAFLADYNRNRERNLSIDALPNILENSKKGNIKSLLVCKKYWDGMDKKDKLSLDEIILSVYDNGGDIVITPLHDHECNTLHAIKRY